MNIFKEFKQVLKEKSAVEQKPSLEPINPFVDGYLDDSVQEYDGNVALAREQWLKEADLETLSLVKAFYKNNDGKVSKQRAAEVLKQLNIFKDKYNFDINFVTGKQTATRLNLFPMTIKEKIVNDINLGRVHEYNEKYLAQTLKGGAQELEQIKERTKVRSEQKQEVEKVKRQNLEEFLKNNPATREVLTTESPLLIVETHEKDEVDYLGEINMALSNDIDKRFLKINYEEKLNVNETVSEKASVEGYSQISDASGRIDSRYLNELFLNQENASVVLTGGNLRGCLASSLESCVGLLKDSKTKQMDIHVPLDKCYDGSSYDEFKNRFPADLLMTYKNLFKVEIYLDGKLTEVSASDKAAVEDKVARMYLWTKADKFTGKLNEGVELKKIRQSLASSVVAEAQG